MAFLNHYRAIVIGGSAGSFQVLRKMFERIPESFSLPIIVSTHRPKHIKGGFVEALSNKSKKEIIEPNDKDPVRRGKVYIAPSNYHLAVELGNTFSLSTEEMLHGSRPAIDITLETAAFVYKEKLIGILLTGANRDGAFGMKKIKEYGGLTIVQDPAECFVDSMPKAALGITKIDYVMKVDEIINFLINIDKKQASE